MIAALLVIAAPAEHLPATGQWVVEFGDAQCIASRKFGDDKDPWTLVIKPSPTSDVTQLIAVKKGSSAFAVQGDARLTFGKSPPMKVKQLSYGIKGNGIRLVNLTPEQSSALAAAETLEWVGDGPDKSFSTGRARS